MNIEEYPEKNFLLYDLLTEKFLRKIKKEDFTTQVNSLSADSSKSDSVDDEAQKELMKFQSDAFDID